MAGNIFQWSLHHIVGGQVLHGMSAGMISGAGWSEHVWEFEFGLAGTYW
jgi:hypothetical protein